MQNKALHMISFLLLIVAGLDFGLSVFGWDFLGYLSGWFGTLVYILIGFAALYELFTHKKACNTCCVPAPVESSDSHEGHDHQA